jgi:hypothetical protein
MKNKFIISEAIYKGKHKLVNQGSFINLSDIVSDSFNCFPSIPCCDNQSDFFIRKAYVTQSRKKPGDGWISLSKIIVDYYNCEKNTTLCLKKNNVQWWISSELIRPVKTIETMTISKILCKVFACCNL